MIGPSRSTYPGSTPTQRRAFPQAAIEKTRSSHFKLKLPNGGTVITSSTPSSSAWLANVHADVRRKLRNRADAVSSAKGDQNNVHRTRL